MSRKRLARYALVAAVTAAISFPLVSQRLRAQDQPAARAAEPEAQADQSDSAEPAKAAQPGEKAKPAGEARPAGKAEPQGEAKPDAPAKDAPKAEGEAGQPEALGSDPKKVIASAGEIQITVNDFVTFVSGLPPQQQQTIAVQPDVRRQVAEHLIRMKVLAREAENRKLDQESKFKEEMARIEEQAKAQVENARLQMLASAVIASLGSDEAADRKYFEEHPEQFGEVQARHILVSTRGSGDPSNPKPQLTDEQAKKKAEEIRARLVKGEDFGKIAKAESDDPGFKENGGTYTFGRGQMVAAFEQTAYGLKVNEISQPVKTQFGYHVIQLQKRIPGTFEASKEDVAKQRVENLVKELTGGEPKLEDSFFRTPATAPRSAAGQPAAPGKQAPKAPK